MGAGAHGAVGVVIRPNSRDAGRRQESKDAKLYLFGGYTDGVKSSKRRRDLGRRLGLV